MNETVKNLSWQLLHGNYRLKLGPERWDQMVQDVGGPDVQNTDSLEDVPMEPFNQACLRLDEELGEGDSSLIIDVAKASVRAWANMNSNLVKSLQGDPGKMMEIFCDEVHPFFLNDPNASELKKVAGDTAVVQLDNGLLEPFKIGLLDGFAELTGCTARTTLKNDGFHVTWSFEDEVPEPSKMALFLEAVRAPFLTATVVPVLVGTALAWTGQGAFDLAIFAAAMLGALLFHVGTNTINDVQDHETGADAANPTPTPFSGGSRVIQRGLMDPSTMKVIAWASFAGGAAIGLVLTYLTGLELLYMGVAGFVLALIYTGKPVRLAHRGLGELAVAAGFGPIMVMGAYYVQTGAYTLEAFVASLPLAALIAAVLYINEFPDVHGDAKVGKRTLVVRLGVDRAIAGYALLVISAYVAVVAATLLDLLPLWSLVSLLSLPLAWKAWSTLRKHYAEPYKLIPANAYTVFLHLTTGLLLAAGIVAGGFLP